MPELVALTPEMMLVMAILAFTIYLFVFEIVRVDVAAVTVMVLVGISGLLPPDRLFTGFSSNAVISIIAVMIIGAGLDKTGVMNLLAGRILRIGGTTEQRIIPVVSATVGVISSFMQNIGAAALFLPVVSRISTRTGIPLGRLLMPMGFCAILGGTITMVGSSPLILLNDLIETSNRQLPPTVEPMETFHLFAVTPIGIALVVTGIVYFVIAGRFVLPKAVGPSATATTTASYFEEVYGLQGEIFEVRVSLDSPLVGRTVGEVEAESGDFVLIGLRNADELTIAPPQDEMIWVGSVLALLGSRRTIDDYCRQMSLQRSRNVSSFIDALNPAQAGIVEVVVPPGSSHVGQRIGDIRTRKRFGLAVVAVHSAEHVVRERVRDHVLRAGDALVVHSRWGALTRLSNRRDLVVVSDFPRDASRPTKVWHALVFFLIGISLVLFTDTRLSLALLLSAVGMILSGVLTIDEAYRSVGWQSVFLLASLIPLGAAVETTGTAMWIAQQTLLLLGDVPLIVLQAALAILATGCTLAMSNVGATVLLVPIAVNVAVSAGGDPATFALVVALATSNAFVLPTHQVNALVMGAAGYRVVDFMRAGGVMTILFLIVMLPMVNLVM